MHALKEMWKPIFDDQEMEVMKMIPAEKLKNFVLSPLSCCGICSKQSSQKK